MNRIKKVSRPVTCLLALLLCVMLLASTAFAAGGALGADRNGTPYTYVIGYMYSGSSQTVNTREIFTSPNNYDIWLCPVCGRDPLGNSQGTALAPNLYMPCYGYDIAAAGGDMSIRYALVRHRHNNGQLSDDRVYIPVNVPMYAGCYYGYDLTEPAGVQVSAPTGWQRDSAVVRFSDGTDTGTSLPDWSAAPGDYGSGIHHYEYSINGGAWTGCPVGDPTVTITAGGETTVTARVVDGAGNASGQTATAKVFIDPAPPNVPSITLSMEQWTNSMVTAAIKDNGDAHSGVARTEYSLDGGSWTAYSGALSIAGHGKHTVSARAIDNVGRISGTASKTALVDKVAPVISRVEQQPDSGHTEMTLAVTATDVDSGVKGYAVTTEEKAPALERFQDSALKVDHNGVYYIWAADKAGNISAAAKVDVTALDIVAPVVVKVETQRTWDAEENWTKVTARDDNSGVVAIGWERAGKNAKSRHAPDPITWVDSTAEAAFIFTENGSYNAYARDLAGNVSEPYPFIIDHIDKHSPVIDSVEWDKGWSQEKTITVKAHDTESGLGQYAVTRTADRPAEWQDSNVFANITENGTYYLWAKDNVQRVSADADADSDGGDGGEGTPDPGPEEIVIDTIDRSKPVMDDILHSAADNAPAGLFSYPHFNEVDRPELLAHDLADEGWTDSGIKAIYYQFAADADSLKTDWLTYDELDKPAMREEYFGNIYAKAEDNAGNVSDAIFAGFMFEQTEPVAEKTLTPDHWTNGAVEIDLSTDDNLSGVRDITLPDGSVVDATQAKYTVDKNGVYNFSVRDYCGNVLTYPVEVSNIDQLAPAADYEVMPGDWTNKPVTIRVTATDPEPEDGYAPSGVKSITMPDGTVVEGDAADFTVSVNLELFDARSNYVSYIAQRPRVQRSGAHGLFTQEEDAPDLNAAARAVSEHDGNIWTCILSLRREDAARLSYDKADAWRALLRANAAEIAARFNVPVGSFHWCGAFHNEAHHPHVHLVCYADRVQKPALTKEGVVQLRSLLARQIFRDELDAIYIRQSQSRDELRDLFSARLKEAVAGMRDAPAEMPVLESLLERLSEEVRDRKGKLRYGYLPWPVKSIVDSIISELEKQPQVKAAYSAWWELRKTVLSTYRDSLPEQAPPLHTQKEFRHLKNIVLRIAKEGCPAPEPEQEFDAVQDPQDRGAQHAVYGAKRLLDAAREEEYPDEDVQAALRTLLTAAERGDAYAQYQAGKLYREGYFLPRDDAGAKMFFERAAKQENHFAEYALGKLHADETSPFFDETKAADWFERAAEHGNGFAKYRLAKGSLS